MNDVVIRDSKGSCPYCNGMITPIIRYVSYRCIDCKTVFKPVDKGYSENGVIVEKVCD